MRANSNYENEEIYNLIELLINELIQHDRKTHRKIMDEYLKNPKYKFLEDYQWKEFIQNKLENYCISENKITLMNERKEFRTENNLSNHNLLSNNPPFLTPENLPAGIISSLVQTQIKKVQ